MSAALLLGVSLLVPAPAAAVPVLDAPGCQGAPESEAPGVADLCPDDEVSDEFDVVVEGEVTEGAAVEIVPDLPPCTDATTEGVYIPDNCFHTASIDIDPEGCAFQDSYNRGSGRPEFGLAIRHCEYTPTSPPMRGTLLYDHVDVYLDLRTSVTDGDFYDSIQATFQQGGWGDDGPETLATEYVFEPTSAIGTSNVPDGLFGPTWIRGTATLRIQVEPGVLVNSSERFWVPVGGSERDRPPRAMDIEKEYLSAGVYRFFPDVRSQWGNGLAYDWTFKTRDVNDVEGEFEVTHVSSFENPDVQFYPNEQVIVELTITDTVNGLTDDVSDFFTLGSGCCGGGTGGLPDVTLEATSPAATEGGSAGAWTLERTGSLDGELDVNLDVSGDATEGSDYAALDRSVTFPVGEDTVVVPFAAINDSAVESDETVTLTLADGELYTVGDPFTGDIVITSDDVAKSKAKVKATATPKQVKAGKRVKVKVKVTSPGGVPVTGKVKVKIGGKSKKATLKRGKATVKVPVGKKAGKQKVKVTYLGSKFHTRATGTATVKVKKRKK